MDLKQFRYFVTVVNEGTISAAAEKLHMTQLNLDSGIVRFAGRIDSMGYQTKSTQKNREPLLKRLLQ